MKPLGQIFKETREKQQLSYDDVTRELKIKRQFIEALEVEDFTVFPSAPMMRGFVRNYAVFLGLNPVEMLALYDGRQPNTSQSRHSHTNGVTFMALPLHKTTSFLSPDSIVTFLIISALLGSIFLFAYTQYLMPIENDLLRGELNSSQNNSSDIFALPTPTLVPTATPTATPTVTPQYYTGVAIELIIHDRSWIQIIADDQKVFSDFLDTGEKRRWDGEKRVAIRAGNGGGVEVFINGVSQGLMGEKGQVVDQLWEKIEEVPTDTSSDGKPTATPIT